MTSAADKKTLDRPIRPSAHLHHQSDRVYGDQKEDEVLEGRRRAQLEAPVAQATLDDGHVEAHRPRVERELHARLLVLVHVGLEQGRLALLLERDDYQRHEDVDKEEGKHNKVDDVEDRVVEFVRLLGAHVLCRHVQRVLQDLGPALSRLYCEQRQKGEDDIVVMELPSGPDSGEKGQEFE